MENSSPNEPSPIAQFYATMYPNYEITKIVSKGEHGHLYLEPLTPAICPDCGEPCQQIDEKVKREIRDVPLIGQSLCTLHMDFRRVSCKKCGGHHLEQIPWIDPYNLITKRLIKSLQFEHKYGRSAESLAADFQLDLSTVKKLLSSWNSV